VFVGFGRQRWTAADAVERLPPCPFWVTLSVQPRIGTTAHRLLGPIRRATSARSWGRRLNAARILVDLAHLARRVLDALDARDRPPPWSRTPVCRACTPLAT
jgi:hypothetical protein